MKYVVKAPGRTGGHLIVDFLKRAPGIEFDYIENNAEFEIDEWVDAKDNSIVFAHTTTCPSDPSEYTLIISKRRNKQAMLLSKRVAGITGKFYGEGTIEQKVKAQFDPMYRILAMQIKNWEEQITQLKTLPWANIHEVYMEDFLTNPGELCKIVEYNHLPDWTHESDGKAVSYKDVFDDPQSIMFIAKQLCKEEGLQYEL